MGLYSQGILLGYPALYGTVEVYQRSALCSDKCTNEDTITARTSEVTISLVIVEERGFRSYWLSIWSGRLLLTILRMPGYQRWFDGRRYGESKGIGNLLVA